MGTEREKGIDMSFTQLIEIQDAEEQALIDHVTGWHRDQFGAAPGYLGARVLADTGQPGRHVIQVNFSSKDEAQENNKRPETVQWARTLRDLGTVTGDAYRSYDEVGTTRDRT